MCSSAAKGIKSLFLVFLSIICSWSTGRYEGNQVQVLFSLVSLLYNDDLILPSSSSLQVQPLMNNFIIFTSNAWSHVWGHLVLWTDANSRVEAVVSKGKSCMCALGQKHMAWQGIGGNFTCSFLPGDLLGLLDIAHTSSPGCFPSAFWNSRPLLHYYKVDMFVSEALTTNLCASDYDCV
jgi:hypothetical protein